LFFIASFNRGDDFLDESAEHGAVARVTLTVFLCLAGAFSGLCTVGQNLSPDYWY